MQTAKRCRSLTLLKRVLNAQTRTLQMIHLCSQELLCLTSMARPFDQSGMGGHLYFIPLFILKLIVWQPYDQNNPEYTQWVELLISFRLCTGLLTPVPVQECKRCWQSPSICPQLPCYASLGEETTAFCKTIRA